MIHFTATILYCCDLNMRCSWFSFLFQFLLTVRFVTSAPDVLLTRGILKGVDDDAITTQKPYHAYYGIPFAQPPLGGLRFKPPQPFYAADPNKVINSDSFRDACIQPINEDFQTPQSEDCLFLNVFTPYVGANGAFNSSNGKKVMVWIHGGGFVEGDAVIYRPARLVTDFDVIVVTIQYRLGPFGFLSSGDDVLPGNNGLRDQILALQWVKDNIRRFGGDPDDVTIFGESAGGASVSILALSPLSLGLFSKVIMMSGTSLTSWAVNSKPEKILYEIAKNTDCLPMFYIPGFSPSYNQHVIDCLEKLPARVLLNAYVEDVDNPTDVANLREGVTFCPAVDGDLLPRDPFSLVADKNYMRRIGALDRKYMIGFTNNEGILYGQVLGVLGLKPEDFSNEDVVRQLIANSVQSVYPFPVTSEIVNFASLVYSYPRDSNGKPQFQSLLDLFTDTSFVVPSVLLARSLVSLSSQVDVFLYVFDHYPEPKDPVNRPAEGSSHAFDLNYLFDENPKLADYIASYAKVWTPSSLPLLDIYRGVMANMAKSGNPSLVGYATWPRYDLREQNYMAISTRPEVRRNIYSRRVSLWTDFLPRVVGAIFSRGPRQGPPIRI